MNLNVLTVADATRMANAIKATDKSGETIAAEATEAVAGQTPEVSADDLYSTLLKIVPVPLLGFYLAFQNLWLTVADDKPRKILFFTASWQEFATWTTLIVFVLLVPAFLAQRKVHRFWQFIVTMFAFVVLAAASQGPFQLIAGWKEWVGTAALFAMGVVLLFFQPQPLPDNVIEDSTP